MIEAIVEEEEEELESALGASKSQRVGRVRSGDRHGARARQLTTSLCQTTIRLPRARLTGADGAEHEWHSPSSRAINGAPSGWTGRCSVPISVTSIPAGCAERYRRCYAARLYPRMLYRAWSGEAAR